MARAVVNDWVFSAFLKEGEGSDPKNKGEEVMLSMVVPAYKGKTGERTKMLELCVMSTHQFTTCKIKIDLDAGPVPQPAPPALPQPPAIPPAPPSTPAPPPTASHEVLSQRTRGPRGRNATPSPPPPPSSPPPPPAPTATPLPPFSVPLSTPTATTELGNTLLYLQNTIQELQSTVLKQHDATNEKIDCLEAQLNTYRAELDAHHAGDLKVTAQLSSDLQKVGNAYYKEMQTNIRSVQSKFEDETAELGKFLKAPAEMMMQEMAEGNKRSLKEIGETMEQFGSDLYEAISNEIGECLANTPNDPTEIARAFDVELKSQLSAMMEKRWEEICDFQVMLELDYAKYGSFFFFPLEVI
eukprot:TRINITY_DN10009_c0_g1_i1.p1 TRINITY_DN10009_c0_g1~~TRINITY_DN10009_c0_g1_i1.p1  ORF type:complete len:355 (+),score=116.93 TRINITY_DN10009_c0_g1_i1:133-1197(+)